MQADHQGLVTRDELAAMAGVNRASIDNLMNPDRQDASASVYFTIAPALSLMRIHHLTRATIHHSQSVSVTANGILQVNGSMADEAEGMMRHFGESLRAFATADPDGAMQALDRAEHMIRQARAEVAQMAR